MTEAALTEEEAAQMLARLSRHFKQPVMPINRYCDALRTWQRCLSERAEYQKIKLFPGIDGKHKDAATQKAFDAYLKAKQKEAAGGMAANTARDYKLSILWSNEALALSSAHTFLQIGKSSLLNRLLYIGEALRSERCPKHDGTWSGLFGECKHGCQLTGWLPAVKNEDAK